MATFDTAPERDKDGVLESKAVGRFIKAKIAEAGLSYTQVADRLNLQPSYLSHMLAGRDNIGRSVHFKPLAELLRLSVDEIQHINPNILMVHPDAAPQPVATQTERPTPAALIKALQAVHAMGLGKNISEADLPRLLPRGLDGKGPQTEGDWVKFLLLVDEWF